MVKSFLLLKFKGMNIGSAGLSVEKLESIQFIPKYQKF